MLHGRPATEQCIVIDSAVFLLNADAYATRPRPRGTPNLMTSTGGTQLLKRYEDDGIYFYKVHVDWTDASKTTVSPPQKVSVAPYHYLCDGQLSNCVSQPGTERRLDSQGDNLMQGPIYRNFGDHQSLVAEHSVATAAHAGGVRWYEFHLDNNGNPALYQQSTYAPDGSYRGWLAWQQIVKAILGLDTPSAAIQITQAGVFQRGMRTTRTDGSLTTNRFSRKDRLRRTLACAGRIIQTLRSIPRTIVRSGLREIM